MNRLLCLLLGHDTIGTDFIGPWHECPVEQAYTWQLCCRRCGYRTVILFLNTAEHLMAP